MKIEFDFAHGSIKDFSKLLQSILTPRQYMDLGFIIIKPHPKCPQCGGSGYTIDSEEGGIVVPCDCPSAVIVKYQKMITEKDKEIKRLGHHLSSYQGILT